MSLFTAHLRFLSLRPAIREEQDVLTIETGILTRLCTLCLEIRMTRVYPLQHRVILRSRMAYLWKSQETIPFSSISHVDYAFKSIGTSWGWTLTGYDRNDQLESFRISIVTKDDKRHFVCSFRGEGHVCTGWSGVLLGEDTLVDYSGTQENESRKFANYLAKLLGVTVGKPVDQIANMAKCPACKRSTSLYKPTCLYCGAQITQFASQARGEQ